MGACPSRDVPIISTAFILVYQIPETRIFWYFKVMSCFTLTVSTQLGQRVNTVANTYMYKLVMFHYCCFLYHLRNIKHRIKGNS